MTSESAGRYKEVYASCFTGLGTAFISFFHFMGLMMYPHLRSRGHNVIMWTANEKSEFDTLSLRYRNKVDGFMTDKPTNLKEWINEYK